ncbi:MAG: hypothetical protein AAF092_06410 [Pseudomonadota bacterium]
MRILFFLLALYPICLPAASQTLVPGRDEHMSELVAEVIQKVVEPTVSFLPMDQRSIIENVEIQIVEGFNVFGPQAGYNSDGRRVVYIPSVDLALQRDYIWTVVIGRAYNTPYFPEFWMSHALARLSGDFDMTRGGTPLSPTDFFGLDEADSIDLFSYYNESVNGFFAASIADILFHELSHFLVEDGIFDWTTTDPATAIKIELSADEFAAYLHSIYVQQVLQDYQHRDTFNLQGRVFSVGLVDEIQSWLRTSGVTPTRRYPTLAERLDGPTRAARCLDEALKPLCSIVQERITVSQDRSDIVAHYEERIDRGEVFAVYRLARYYLLGGQQETGCQYLDRDTSDHGRSSGVNQVLWAVCLDASLVWQEKSRGDRLSEASRYYCDAWKNGFNTYQRYRDIIDYLGWPDHCSSG